MTKDRIKIILSRRSIRQYTKQPVSEDDIKTLLEAAMAAPSASNLKPWHFIITTNRETLDKLAEIKSGSQMLHNAPLCIAVCGMKSASPHYWVQDCSAATENLLLAATTLGLGAVWLGIYPHENRVDPVKKIFNLPDDIIPLSLISIGHPAEEKAPRTQYDGSRVHKEHW
jgi:nitroreductase